MFLERQSATRMSDRRQNESAPRSPHQPGDALSLETLGTVALLSTSAGGERTTIFGASKPLALIVYLASVPGNAATREFLIDLLWADVGAEAARHAFRQTLWYVKQKAGRALIRADGDMVSLAEPVPSDRAEFLKAAEQRDFGLAVSLYRGDFLLDFAAPGGVEFEHWADLERRRLRDVFTRSAEHEVRRCLRSARQRDAVALSRRARDVDPLSEQSWRLVLESLVSANDALGAAVEADALEAMLAAEDRVPEHATRAMLRTAKRVASEALEHGPAPSAIVGELVGRQSEFANLCAAWDLARNGTAQKISVIGQPGIGKTRLLTDIVARLQATRARVVAVRANPGERDISYAFLSKLAGALGGLPGAAAVSPASAASLIALNPTLSAAFNAEPDRSAGPDAMRLRTLAVHELLVAAADEAPIAVMIDDLHWADRESMRALAGVSALLESERVLLVAAMRPSRVSMPQPARDTEVIHLGALTVDDTAALLASIGTLPVTPVGERLPAQLQEATGGVPLLVIETLEYLLDTTAIVLERSTWVVADEARLLEALSVGGALRRRVEALEDFERSVLDAVSLAGVPVPIGFIADAVGRSLPNVAAVLHGLEMRGMVGQLAGLGWEPAHDQIGELALAGMNESCRRSTELGVARAWLHGSGDDTSLRRAGTHFLRAGDERALRGAFVAWARALRQRGDHRAARELASEFVNEMDEAHTQMLAAALPFPMRYPSARWYVAALVVVVAIASAAAIWQWAFRPAAAPDEQFLAVTVDSNQDTSVYRVGIDRNGWQPGVPLRLAQVGKRVRVALPASLKDYAVTRDGASWISSEAMPDSGDGDLVLEPMTGGTRRLTWAPGDDGSGDLAPDGSLLVFQTGRYDSLSHAHLAIMDLATHAVRELTGGSGVDLAPKWSPSGLWIAFARRSLSGAPDSVCVVAPDGTGSRCHDVGPSPITLGWLDGNRVLVSAMLDTSTILETVDTRDGAVQRLEQEASAQYELSGDGQWVVCECRGVGAVQLETIVFPIDHPALARPIERGAKTRQLLSVLWPTRRPAWYVTRLSVPLPARGIPIGAAYQLGVTGVTVDGRQVAVPTAEVVSIDTSVLRVAPHLRLVPMQPGPARIVISAGGWRLDTLVTSVVPERDSVALQEDWEGGIEPDFVPFGDPMPVIVAGGDGRPAFWNHGNGSYQSGAYTSGRFDATPGFGVEMTMSTPINFVQWQLQSITLQPPMAAKALAQWDHRTGYPPFYERLQDGVCATTYPAIEGPRNVYTLRAGGPIVNPDTIFQPPIHDGHWYTMRLQLFPDGRCGVAINGRPIAIWNTGVRPTKGYFVSIAGKSYHTRILTGPVTVWTGIRPGVDWLKLDTAASERTAASSNSR